MFKAEDKKASRNGSLVLGFDAGCFACNNLAKRIEEAVGEKIEVRSLHDPQMEYWRKQALGANASWAPTLVEVKHGKTNAWTGTRMGIRLSRSLGPMATWRVMQVLGEVGAEGASEEDSLASKAVAGMSRGRFLKGVGGAVVAMSMVTGVGSLAKPAEAVEKNKSLYVRSRQISGRRTNALVRQTLGQQDVHNVVGQDLSRKITSRSGKVGLASMHKLKDGNYLLAVSTVLEDKKVLFYSEVRGRSGRKTVKDTEAAVWELDDKEEVAVLKAASQNGELDSLDVSSQGDFSAGDNTLTARARCGRCTISRPKYLRRVCRSQNVTCALGSCAACIPTAAWSGIWGGWVGVGTALFACIISTCPTAARLCCRRWVRRCRKCCCQD